MAGSVATALFPRCLAAVSPLPPPSALLPGAVSPLSLSDPDAAALVAAAASATPPAATGRRRSTPFSKELRAPFGLWLKKSKPGSRAPVPALPPPSRPPPPAPRGPNAASNGATTAGTAMARDRHAAIAQRRLFLVHGALGNGTRASVPSLLPSLTSTSGRSTAEKAASRNSSAALNSSRRKWQLPWPSPLLSS